MSLPIWLKFCMKVVEEYQHHEYEEELGRTNFYCTAQPTKNGAYRDFLKIHEILIFSHETPSFYCV